MTKRTYIGIITLLAGLVALAGTPASTHLPDTAGVHPLSSRTSAAYDGHGAGPFGAWYPLAPAVIDGDDADDAAGSGVALTKAVAPALPTPSVEGASRVPATSARACVPLYELFSVYLL